MMSSFGSCFGDQILIRCLNRIIGGIKSESQGLSQGQGKVRSPAGPAVVQ
jgi:hypothetical protein